MKHTLIASTLATGLVLASLACAARAEEPELRQVRLCDMSACYYAWNVVDRDGDGVSDADEAVAGTDPLDAASRPPLPLIVDMIGAQLLPTFEFGVGKMIVRPADLQAALEKYGGTDTQPGSPLPAFPLGDRKDAMTRLGLDAEQMEGFGLSLEFDGLSLVRGFDREGSPVRRVGGVDVSLIGAGADDEAGGDVPEEGPKVIYSEPFDNGDLFIKLDNGDQVLIHKDGSHERTGPDGFPKKGSGYVNPDAGAGGDEPTDEQIEAWKRVRDATKRTLFAWEPIQIDPEQITDRKGTVILIDPEHPGFEGIVSGPPQIDRAQPEAHPGLPNPADHVDACWPKCN